MKSKIIKVSIILIFMMFSAGLFNFCFALTLGTDFVQVDSFVTQGSGIWSGVIKIADLLVDFDLPTAENSSAAAYNTLVNNGYILAIDNGDLICYIPDKPSCVLYKASGTTVFKWRNIDNLDNDTYVHHYKLTYNFDTNIWSVSYVTSGVSSVSLQGDPRYLVDNQFFTMYDVGLDESNIVYVPPVPSSSIDMKVVQTGTRTGHVEFTAINWDSHMYYIKDDMDELVRLIAEEELSVTHEKVKYYDGPVSIEYGEYVLGLLFDENGEVCFSQISDSVTIDYDSVLDTTHKLYLNKEDENIYYLSIHGYQEEDYVRVSDKPISSNLYDEKDTLILSDGNSEYNGLNIGYLYETALNNMNRKITVNKNGVTYFYLYDSNDTLVNSVVLNSSNYYSGEEYDFDVDLSFGSSPRTDDALHMADTEIRWVKVNPIINIPSIDNYELYLKIVDFGNIPYINEENRVIYVTHDSSGNKPIGIDVGSNSNSSWFRIDDLIYDYFYINTGTNNTTFTFELQLRSSFGQVIETKQFKVSLSIKSNENGTISSTTNGKDDTYIRNPDELSGNISNSNKFDFSGLNDLTEQDLKTNVEGLIDSSIGFFGLLSTMFLLLPTWVSSLLYLFFFGMIIITLLRFLRGS